ncbi:MAG: DUF4912 domain-containing protein [Treponema sp.]
MRKRRIKKSQLQSLATSDLIDLANSLELFVPPNFSRSSLIKEILDLESGLENLPYNILKMLPLDDEKEDLPTSYGMTEIRLLLKDPMWLFAFWDINANKLEELIEEEPSVSIFLRVMSFKSEEDDTYYAFEDIDVKKEERYLYIHTSINEEVTQVALCYKMKKKTKILAKSNFIYMPRRNIKNNLCIDNSSMSEIMKLSGLEYIQQWHFQHYKGLFEEYSFPE